MVTKQSKFTIYHLEDFQERGLFDTTKKVSIEQIKEEITAKKACLQEFDKDHQLIELASNFKSGFILRHFSNSKIEGTYSVEYDGFEEALKDFIFWLRNINFKNDELKKSGKIGHFPSLKKKTSQFEKSLFDF